MLKERERRGVVHVVDKRDAETLRDVARIAGVLTTQRVGQSLVTLEPAGGRSLARRIVELRAELDAARAEREVHAVHLHGWEACVLGAFALRPHTEARVVCSPRGARFGGAWAAPLVAPMLRSRLAPFHHAILAGTLAEGEALGRLLGRAAEVLAPPVPARYFDAPRREPPRPRVVAQVCGEGAVRLATRLSVLMNGREPRVDFGWIGDVDARMRGQLEAAHVRELHPDEALPRAWVYLAVSQGERLPVALAHAMAAGVPCLVADSAAHRALIQHGETGFLCASERDFLEHAVFLLRNAPERRSIGEAARADAARRFTELNYRRALLRVYGLPAPAAIEKRSPCPPLQIVV